MDIHVNVRSSVPITKQIVEQIQHMLAAGILKSGDQLPTVRALASELRINFNTVARAYRLLDDSDLITTQRGRGTYVLEIPSREILEHLRNESFNASGYRYMEDARRLGFGKKQAVANLRKLSGISQDERSYE